MVYLTMLPQSSMHLTRLMIQGLCSSLATIVMDNFPPAIHLGFLKGTADKRAMRCSSN
jgi:hypothetical protein